MSELLIWTLAVVGTPVVLAAVLVLCSILDAWWKEVVSGLVVLAIVGFVLWTLHGAIARWVA